MNDIQLTQHSFAKKALHQPQHRFADLYHLICRKEWIEFALTAVLRNTGSRTAGVDGITKRDFESEQFRTEFIAQLQQDLKQGVYRPSPVKRQWIPKPSGEKRGLGIPTIRDRTVQMLLKMHWNQSLKATLGMFQKLDQDAERGLYCGIASHPYGA